MIGLISISVVCFIILLFCSYMDEKERYIAFSDLLYSFICSIIPVANVVISVYSLFHIADNRDFVIIGKKND